MRYANRLAVACTLGLLVCPALADVELLLKDGSTVSGTDLRLKGGRYHVETETGEIVEIAVERVAELRLLGPPGEEPPLPPGETVAGDEEPVPTTRADTPMSGWRKGEARDLAGTPARLVPAPDQTAVFGEPAKFRKTPFEFRWKPVQAFDPDRDVFAGRRSTWQSSPFQNVWKPKSAFDDEDVLAGSRSEWIGGPVREWRPEERGLATRAEEPPDERPGLDWRRLTEECAWCGAMPNGPRRFLPGPSSAIDAERCADRLFADFTSDERKVVVEEVENDLGVALYDGFVDGGPRALFSIEGQTCRLIAGDVATLTGIALSEEQELAYAVSAWNQALVGVARTVRVTPEQQLELAFELVRLFEPAGSGAARGRVELLRTQADLDRELRAGTACEATTALRRRQRAEVERNFSPPGVVQRDDETRVSFAAWWSYGGRVAVYDVRLALDGRISMSRELLAGHLGEHEEAP